MLSFDGDEENLIESVISILDAGREKFIFQKMNLKSNLQHKGIMLDLERREVMRNNDKIALTYTEFEILQLLAQNPGRVFSKEQIYDMVWQEPYSGDYNIVMSHISHIREKIEDDPSHPVYIQMVIALAQATKSRETTYTINDAMDVLLSKLDEAIDDMENGRVQTVEEAWAEIDAV